MSKTYEEDYSRTREHYEKEKLGANSYLSLTISFAVELACKNLGGCEHADNNTIERFAYDLVVYPEPETLILPFHCRKCNKPAPVKLKVSGIRWGVG